MESFFSRYKNPFVLALVLGAQLLLLAVQVKRPFPAATAAVDQAGVQALRLGMTTVVAPPESVLHTTGKGFRGIWDSYLDLIGVRQENQQLRQQVNQLQLEEAELAEDAREGQRLEDLLAFRQHYIDATVPAQVIGSSGNDRARIVYIDKGSNDGLAVDMPVITPDGIVGRVREVYPRTSQVIEISDPGSAAGVLLEETRTRGILRGISTGEPAVTSLMPDDRIKPGQRVLTSGGDGIFPRGLPVGTVARIVPDRENEPMVDVVLKPAANLSRLEEVLVVTGTAPAPTEKTRRDLARSEAIAAAAFKAQVAAAQKAAQDEAQRASDILAARLPSREEANPDAPDASPDASPMTSEADARPLHPLGALHPDHYTPQSVPQASGLTPGERYAPLAQGTGREHPAAKGADGTTEESTASAANPAFAAAAAAVDAQRKVVADAKAAEAAKRYDALHPKVAVPQPAAAAEASVVPASSPAGVMHYVTRTNADGTTAQVAVPGPAADGSGFRLVTRTNADGTTARVAVPVAAGSTGGATTAPQIMHYVTRTNPDGTTARVALAGPAADGSGFRYVTRTNADGTTARVAVPVAAGSTAGATTAPQIMHYVTRTNPDGTTARVALAGPAADGSGFRYVTRTNADGTTARVAVPVAAGSTAGATAAPQIMHYVTRTNADGTTARVALAGPAADGSGFRYITRTNADGTTARVAVPVAAGSANTSASTVNPATRTNPDGTTTRAAGPAPATGAGNGAGAAVHYVTRTNPDGTTSRVAVPGPAPTASTVASPGNAAPPARYVTSVNADGTTTRVAVPGTTSAPGAGSAAPAGTHFVARVNADGTTTRIAVPNTPANAASTAPPGTHYVTRVNADGSTTRVAVPNTASNNGAPPAGTYYVTRVNPDGTTTRIAVPNAPRAQNPAAPPVHTTIVNDGPDTGARRAPQPAPAAPGPQGAL